MFKNISVHFVLGKCFDLWTLTTIQATLFKQRICRQFLCLYNARISTCIFFAIGSFFADEYYVYTYILFMYIFNSILYLSSPTALTPFEYSNWSLEKKSKCISSFITLCSLFWRSEGCVWGGGLLSY